MAISSENNRNDAVGGDSTATYNYTFRITSESHLLVTVKNPVTDIESTLTIDTDYTVTGVGDSSGGSIVLVDASQDWISASSYLDTDWTITIRRNVDIVQETDIRNQGDFFPEVHEDAFDYLTFIDQQQQDQIDRSVKSPESLPSSSFDPTLPTDINTASVSMVTNPSGTGFIIGPTTTEIAGAAASATAAEASSTLAQSWAVKVDGQVAATDYSSKAWAVGGTGVTDTASRGAAKEWATKAEDSTVDGSEFSALHYSAKSSASATASAASATLAQNAAASVIWNDVVFLTNADSPYTASNSDRGKLLAVDCSSGAVTVNLPSIAALDLTSPFVLGIKKTDSSANAITIARDGTDTIDGDTSKTISVADSGSTFIPDTDPTPDEWTTADFGSSAGNLTVDNFNGDGSTVAFVLSVDPGTENNTFVYVDGVYQQKNTYSLSGTTLTFTEAPPTGTNNIEVSIGTLLSIGTPSDGTVTRAKLADGAVANKTVSTKTTAYTATSLDNILLCNASGAAFAVTLPTAVGISGKELMIKKIGSDYNNVTVDGDGTETIDGATTYVLYLPNEYIKIVSDGTNWQLIQEHLEPVACAATYSGSTGDTTGVIPFDGSTYDTTSGLNTGTGVFTAKAPGKYRASVVATIALSGTPANDFVDIVKNSTDIARIYSTALTGSTSTTSSCGIVSMDLAEGDTISFQINGDASFDISSESKMFIDRISR